jgi:manganese transport protein
MEGFLNFRMRPWLRRLITRTLAVIPAALTIWIAGEHSVLGLLILSQVILSMQLPFAVIPLIHFTCDRTRMGSFRNAAWVQVLAWITALFILLLNVRLIVGVVGDWLAAAGPWRPLLLIGIVAAAFALVWLLGWVVLEPWLHRLGRAFGRAPVVLPEIAGAETTPAPFYHRILVPLDHSARDRLAIGHAAALARLHSAVLYLFHVEEGPTSSIYGGDASTAEVEAGEQYIEKIAQGLRRQGIEVETAIVPSQSPKRAIVRYAREIHPDLIVMGAHGHGGLKDLVFGTTIDPVRHELDIPILVVRPGIER